MAANYYIYRNLTKGVFSIKYKGIIIEHLENLIATDVTFKVSEKGRLRVLKESRKNVHAYVVCSSYKPLHGVVGAFTNLVYYNPYELSSFVTKANNGPIYKAKHCQLVEGKFIYIDSVAPL